MQKEKTVPKYNIQFFRELAGLSLDDLAGMLQIDTELLEEWENGADLTEEELSRVAVALDLGVSWLKKELNYPKGTYNQIGNHNHLVAENGTVEYNYNYPVEHVVEAYKGTLEMVDKCHEKLIFEKDKQIQLLKEETRTLKK